MLFYTGVTGPSAFSKLPEFSVLFQSGPDLFHDIYEGTGHKELAESFSHFIKEGYLTLENLNDRLADFQFGPFVNNKPGPITKNNLENKHFAWTGSETGLVISTIPFIIGDLIPNNDKFWQLILMQKKITEKLFKKRLSKSEPKEINELIQKHHNHYIQIGGKMIPKHHFWLHYVEDIDRFGPLSNICALR